LVGFVGVSGQQLVPGTKYTYEDVLKKAVYFGIVANTINKDAHMDSNFATKHFTGSGNVTAGAYTGSNNPGIYVIGDMDSSSLRIDVGGSVQSEVWCTDADKDKITIGSNIKHITSESSIDTYVSNMISNCTDASNALFRESTYHVSTVTDMNNAEIDISKLSDGTYYISGDDDAFKSIANGGLKLKKKSTQTIVFNYSGQSVTLNSYSIWNTDISNNYIQSSTNTGEIDPAARTIIYNMPNANDLYISSGIAGVVLAPKAILHGLGGTSSGWLVVNTMDKNNSEWHCTWQGMPVVSQIPVPATLSAIKTVDGNTPQKNTFSFKLQYWNNGSWEDLDTVNNNGASVVFPEQSYGRTGEYYYRINEIAGSEDYVYDASTYVVKVVIGYTEPSYTINSIEYYKGNGISDCTATNQVESASFNNKTVVSGTGNLKVTKSVTGNAGDTSKEFSFTVTLSDSSINGTYGDMTFTNGVATFTLKNGDEKTAANLPVDVTYTVSEVDYSADGYTTTKTDDTGTVSSTTSVASFTNTKNTTPDTPSTPDTP
jgi:hypothetical protein